MLALLSVLVAICACFIITLLFFRMKFLKFIPIIPNNSIIGYTYPIIPSKEGDGHARMLELAEKFGEYPGLAQFSLLGHHFVILFDAALVKIMLQSVDGKGYFHVRI